MLRSKGDVFLWQQIEIEGGEKVGRVEFGEFRAQPAPVCHESNNAACGHTSLSQLAQACVAMAFGKSPSVFAAHKRQVPPIWRR